MSEKFSEAVGNVVGDYTWLLVDALMLLLILAALLGYQDFDQSMQTLLRGMLVAFWGYIWISGLHLLIYLRHVDRNLPMPGIASYSMFSLKFLLLVAFGLWANYRGLL